VQNGRAAEFRSWVVPDFDADFEEEAICDGAQAV
jgi:hypothetical protein